MSLSSLVFYTALLGMIGSAFMAFYWLWVRPTNPVEERLKEINPRLIDDIGPQPVSSLLVERVAKRLDKLGPTPSPHNVRRLRRRLMKAGFFDENAVMIFRAI